MEPFFKRAFPVRAFEADPSGLARPISLLNFLQEAALDHAAALGVAVLELQRRDLTWVLSRYLLRFQRYPAVGETVEVQTWPSAREGMFTFRDFEVSVGAETVLSATSSWALLDLRSRRPVRLADALPDYPLHRHRVLTFPPERLPAPQRTDLELVFRVRRSDLDINRHVNNAVYLDWALESVPAEVAARSRPAEIEIAYRAEAFYGDTVLVRTETAGGDAFLHRLTSRGEGRELARVRTLWRDF